MKLLQALVPFGLITLVCSSELRPRTYETHDYYVLHIEESILPTQIAERLVLQYEGKLGELQDHHLFSAAKSSSDVVKSIVARRKDERRRGLDDFDLVDGVKFSQKQILKPKLEKRERPSLPIGSFQKREGNDIILPDAVALARQQQVMNKLQIMDPVFKDQWHLFNPVEMGHDINVTDVWMQGITGHNTTVAVVDDGLDLYSNDLKDNYFSEGSYDFNNHTSEPRPSANERHGTRCAGEIAAVKNDVCGVGVAWNAKIAGIRILSGVITDADEAVALNYAYHQNQIYSCSWGPPDNGKSMDEPGILIKRAMLNGVQNGREGKGSIFVFASGNGAFNEDNCNFDGYTNSIYSITVGAIDRKGLHPYYSEKCSAQLVVTYSSGSGNSIHTTDIGQQCSSNHGGTSAAAPIAAGVYSLVLQIRPDLTWRDMQCLVIQTALPFHLEAGEEEWQNTANGKPHSHTFGYGKIDTWATVEAAKTFKNVKPQSWYHSPWIHVNETLPEDDVGIAIPYEVTEEMLQSANLERVEHVTVTMNVRHSRRGDLSVELTSPDGVKSYLSTTRRLDNSRSGYNDWTFMSVAHWGESGIGTWTVIVRDTVVNERTGTFIDWHLKLWGECIDPSKAVVLPMPTDEDDANHAVIEITPTQVSASTPTVTSTHSPTSDSMSEPTDIKTPAVTQKPSPQTKASPSSKLTKFLLSLRIRNSIQIWMYGPLVLIAMCWSGLGIYICMTRRNHINTESKGNHELDMLDEEEGHRLTHGDQEEILDDSD